MKSKYIKLIIILLSIAIFSISCSDEMPSFQRNEAPPKVSLFDLLNEEETPALLSMFEDLDPREFNYQLNDLLLTNPELIVLVSRKTADTFYGDNVIFTATIETLH